MKYILFITKFFIFIRSGVSCNWGCSCTKGLKGGVNVKCINAGFISFPDELPSLTMTLDLSGNPLANLEPYTFHLRNLSNVETITLRRCSIRNIDTHAFSGLPRLYEINLSHNLLASIPSNVFDTTPQLRELILSGNPMLIVENNAFAAVSQLIRLELSEAQIKYIGPRGFYGLELVEWIKLDGNLLEGIHASTLSSLRSLRRMELHHNPWQCTCAIRAIKTFVEINKIFTPVPSQCFTPSRLKGRYWQRTPIEELACEPVVSLISPSKEVFMGENIKLECQAEANPPASIIWMHNGVEILINPRRRMYSVEGETEPPIIYKKEAKKMKKGGKNKREINNMSRMSIFEAGTNEKTSELFIKKVTFQDLGTYSCYAVNRGGKASANVTITIDSRDSILNYSAFRGMSGLILLCIAVLLLLSLISCGICSVRESKKINHEQKEEAEAPQPATKQFIFIDESEKVTTTILSPSQKSSENKESDEIKTESEEKPTAFESTLREMRASLTESDHRSIPLKLGVLKRRTSNASEFSEASILSKTSIDSLITEEYRKRGVDRYRLVTRRGSEDIYMPDRARGLRFKEDYSSDNCEKIKYLYPDVIENTRFRPVKKTYEPQSNFEKKYKKTTVNDFSGIKYNTAEPDLENFQEWLESMQLDALQCGGPSEKFSLKKEIVDLYDT
ncbi:amphoterin-induced protein 1-like [Artemia franciscana]|uniref:Ig-like domain-containing protein n=1 Tax=Artemia franciscana TaxID=6661 RepID=A0AA88I341_ARTSF|nr:hypothetical protein QYM36_006172 [Artemia franciscana]